MQTILLCNDTSTREESCRVAVKIHTYTLIRKGFIKNWAPNNLEILKVQSGKLYNNKYKIASKQIKNTEVFAFITVIDFNLLSRKILFINRKDSRTC